MQIPTIDAVKGRPALRSALSFVEISVGLNSSGVYNPCYRAQSKKYTLYSDHPDPEISPSERITVAPQPKPAVGGGPNMTISIARSLIVSHRRYEPG